MVAEGRGAHDLRPQARPWVGLLWDVGAYPESPLIARSQPRRPYGNGTCQSEGPDRPNSRTWRLW